MPNCTRAVHAACGAWAHSTSNDAIPKARDTRVFESDPRVFESDTRVFESGPRVFESAHRVLESNRSAAAGRALPHVTRRRFVT